MPMAGDIWGAANPWAWMTGRASTNWWQMPMPFYGNWSSPLGFGMAGTGWPSAYSAWAGMFQTPTPFSMFGGSPWQPGVPITFPMVETAAVAVETMKFIEASYRTAGGHATAAIFRAMEPRVQTRALSWSH
jgi:hypothetical protein